jgi:hypothetical protein
MLNQDYKEMLQCLLEEQAEFLVVGAYALAAHGFPRSTADFDIWVNPSGENAEKVFRALSRFGAPLAGVSPADFTQKGTVFQIGVAPCRIDILTMITGNFDFSDARAKAVEIELGGVSMPVLCIDDLIENKLAAGRPKDIEDAEKLKKNRLS